MYVHESAAKLESPSILRIVCFLGNIIARIMFQSSSDNSISSPTKSGYDAIQNITKCKESNFDDAIKEKWEAAQIKGLFRYKLNIQDSKFLDGKYQFLAQNLRNGKLISHGSDRCCTCPLRVLLLTCNEFLCSVLIF